MEEHRQNLRVPLIHILNGLHFQQRELSQYPDERSTILIKVETKTERATLLIHVTTFHIP